MRGRCRGSWGASPIPATRSGRPSDCSWTTSAAYLPLAPALIVVTPLSGIPLLPLICGITIALVSMQMILGRRQIWLPEWLRRRRVRRERLMRALSWLVRPLRVLDRIRHRLPWLVQRPLAVVPQALCILCGLAMPFLELVPMTSSILGAAVACLAITLVAGDGLFALGGMAVIGTGCSSSRAPSRRSASNQAAAKVSSTV
jgi:hypothetical protein